MRRIPLLLLTALVLTLSSAACEKEEETGLANTTVTAAPTATQAPAKTPGPTSTLPPATPTPAPPAPTSAPESPSPPGPSLGEALVGGEMAAAAAIARPNLVYAVKEGRHVTVLVQDIMTGTEQDLLEYDESIEARHSANTWEELSPSVALSPTQPVLLYVTEDEVIAYDIQGKTSETLLRKGRSVGSGDLPTNAWVSDNRAWRLHVRTQACPARRGV